MNQKRKIGKKIAAWFMCLAMVLSILNLPCFTTTVVAAPQSNINLQISTEGIATWTEFSDAYVYKIFMYCDGALEEKLITTETTFDIKKFLDNNSKDTGRYEIIVEAINPLGDTISYCYGEYYQYRSQKEKLPEPTNLKWSGSLASWSEVPNATSYRLKLKYANGETRTIINADQTQFDFGSDAEKGMYFTVVARDNDYRDSNESESADKLDDIHSIIVHFSMGLGSGGTMKSEILTTNSAGIASYTLPSCAFVAPMPSEYYDFDCWESNQLISGSYKNHKPGEIVSLTENIVLTAIWKDKDLLALDNKDLFVDVEETFSVGMKDATYYRWDVIDDEYNYYKWTEVEQHATVSGRETDTLTITPKDLWLDGKRLVCNIVNSHIDFDKDTKPITLSVDINPYQTGKAGDDATWTLNTKTGELKIIGTGKLYDSSADEHWFKLDNFSTLIKTVVIDEGITGGATGTFSYLSSITSIKLPSTYETISGGEFMSCTKLEEIWIPAGLKSIEGGSFWNDKNFKTIYFYGTEKTWNLVEMDRADKYNAEFLNAEVIYLGKDCSETGNHDFSKCVSNGDGTHKVMCKDCDTVQEGHDKDACSGGKATCTKKAKCDKCGKGYGSVAEHTLKTTTTKATLTADGKKETKCTVCEKVTKTTKIYAAKTIKLSKTTYAYDGKAKKPTVTVKDSKGKAIATSNYSVKYDDGRKNVGKYNVKITFKGDYKGSKTLTFTINPKATTLKSVTPDTKAFTAKWTKQTTQVDGYEVEYALDDKFTSSAKKVAVTKNITTSKKISSLKAKKTYYVRVRTYKKVGTKKYYSDWSKVLSVKTK